jgi:NAD(P)H-hydrate epimerase
MSIPVDCFDGTFGKKSIKQIKNTVKNGKFSSITVGMGMSITENTTQLIKEILKINLPLVIDADGLNNLSKIENFKELLQKRKKPTVLTPHIGEMSRLTGLNSAEILDNMEEVAKEFSKETGCFVVLKSSRVLIATPDEEVYYSIKGNEGMATAGTGDVLAGILGALINRLEVKDALILGVYLHGLSGDLAVKDLGKESLKATDLIDYISAAYFEIEKEIKNYKSCLIRELN